MIGNQTQEPSSSNLFEPKYKKAVKEIRKLVSLNTAAKKEINYFKSLYEEEAQENESLRQMVYQIEQNYTNAHTSDRSYGSINSGKKYIATTPIQEVEKEFESTEAISDFTDQKRKLIECQETIHHQSQLISSLNENLLQKNKQCSVYQEQIINLQKELQKEKEQNNHHIYHHETEQKRLKDSLFKSEEQLQQLKKKLHTYENSWTSIQSEKSFIPKIAELQYLREKTASLTFENKKMNKKLKEKKQKHQKDVQQLREENLNMKQKIEKLMIFMNKQQQYIEHFCDSSSLRMSRY